MKPTEKTTHDQLRNDMLAVLADIGNAMRIREVSLADMSRKTGIARSNLSGILAGKRPVSLTALGEIASVVGIRVFIASTYSESR